MRYFRFLCCWLLVLPLSAKCAQDDPSHLFRLTQNIKMELERLTEAHVGKSLNVRPLFVFGERRERHLRYKIKQIFNKLIVLKQLSYLDYQQLEYLVSHDLSWQNNTRLDNSQLLSLLLTEISQLRRLKLLDDLPQSAPFVSGKTLGHVFDNLESISSMLDGVTGGTSAKHNYSLILSILDDIKLIRAKQRIATPVEAILLDKSKTPTDVCLRAYQLLETSAQLSKKTGYQIPGGVVFPQSQSGRKIPYDCLALLNQIQAELSAIKTVVGVGQPSLIVPLEPGKTPPDVYRQISKAIALLKTLL